MGAAANGNGAAPSPSPPRSPRASNGNKARKPPSRPVVARSGRGPVASATLAALVLLTPLALVLLGLIAADPRDNCFARRAEAALGPPAHSRVARLVRGAAPRLPPAAATLAAWAGDAWGQVVVAARRGKARASKGRGKAGASSSSSAPTCQLSGTVDAECCHCTYADVQRLNEQHVAPLVSQLVKTAFFRYFKVNIACDCPLWPDDSMCALKACSVCQCGDDEVPAPWLAAEKRPAAKAVADSGDNKACSGASDPECSTADCALEASGRVDTRLDDAVASRLRHLRGWRGVDNPWIFNATEHARRQKQWRKVAGGFGGGGGGGGGKNDDDDDDQEEDEEQYQYINLLANPERYTGYKGEHAHRIWAAIYGQSCFASSGGPTLLKQELERCTEKRVFYRLISGMHASISAHLVGEWLLDEEKGEWGPNLSEFRRRFVDEPDAAERVANLYFAYLFVLRAVTKAAPVLADPRQYDTGNPQEDARARELVLGMFGEDGTAAALRSACPLPFDEGRLWRGEEGPELRRQLQSAFQNITRVMDCVGCEKCKLWGKLQTLGVATALKILFSEEDCEGNPGHPLRLAAGGGGGVDGGAVGVAGGKDGKDAAATAAAAAVLKSAADDDSSSDDYADGYDDGDDNDQGGGGGGGKAAAATAAKARGPPPPMTLERNEVIALVNLLGRFSNSLRLYHELLRRVAQADSSVASDEETVLA